MINGTGGIPRHFITGDLILGGILTMGLHSSITPIITRIILTILAIIEVDQIKIAPLTDLQEF